MCHGQDTSTALATATQYISGHLDTADKDNSIVNTLCAVMSGSACNDRNAASA